MASERPSTEDFNDAMGLTKHIRNVCILAHVDHGKTTIADSLLATNRIVSKRLAGTIRYLDDRSDEQERGITMKSSAVSLGATVKDEDTDKEVLLLLNLVDTPGHIDFSTEVGAALRLCEGSLIVVDLVEGVCVQTREAIKLAFSERCKMLLVLNKMDKLIVGLHKDVNEIFQIIIHVIEDCNAIIAELYQYENCDIDIEDTGLLFSPDVGNVIFASGLDGWGFTLKQIASLFTKTLKDETKDSINSKLWNFDAYADGKSGTIKLGAIEKGKTNLFTMLCLKTIVYIYSNYMQNEEVIKIAQKLNIEVNHEMKHTDPKIRIRAVMQAWSHLAEVLLHQCLKIISPPSELNEGKIKYLLDYDKFCENEQHRYCLDKIIPIFKTVTLDDAAPCVVYVSKMFCIDNKNLAENKIGVFMPKPRNKEVKVEEVKTEVKIEDTSSIDESKVSTNFTVMALARVFSGTLKTGQEIYVLPPNHAPGEANHAQLVTIKQLYLLFGRELAPVKKVAAGYVCGIAGLETAVVRTATLSTTLDCAPFVEHPTQPPIVRNAIEPVNPKDLPVLRQGLRILMQSDSCVQVIVEENGEYVLVTAGDVHLAKCIEDLTTKFTNIKVNVSSPMVSLRETVKDKCENIFVSPETSFRLIINIMAVPDNVSALLQKHYKVLSGIEDHQTSGLELFAKRDTKPETLQPPGLKKFHSEVFNTAAKHIREQLDTAFQASGSWKDFKIWSVGRMSDSINLLINGTEDYSRSIFETLDEKDPRSCFDHFIVNAFNNCCKSGPLCEEPLMNCAFIIKKFELISNDLDGSTKSNVNIDSTLNSAFRDSIEKHQLRLMEPVFTTSIQVNTNILGKVYAVVSKRHGKVLEAVGMDELEKYFLVKAQIPVVESEGFANEIRKTTSGQAMPTLKFSHFEIIDGDPFYEPVEDDEDEEDVNVESAVRAMKLRKAIRRRKGLHVEEQVVVHGEKQRTLNKKK